MARSQPADEPADDEPTALRITLGTNELHVDAVRDMFARLYSIDPDFKLEIQLLSRPDGVEFYVCTDAAYASRVEHIFRRLFPDETSIETQQQRPTGVVADPSAALELYGWSERRGDWQTGLKPIAGNRTSPQFPLASVVDTLADADATVVYQTVLTPKRPWTVDAELRIDDLLRNRDTYGQRLSTFITGNYEIDASFEDAHRTHQERIEAIREANPSRSFSVNGRAIAAGPGAHATIEALGNAFQPVESAYYHVVSNTTTDEEATTEIAERLEAGTCRQNPSLSMRLLQRVPVIPNNSPEIVADTESAPNFCLLDGASLTNEGRRALQATPDERTGVPHPEAELLEQYDEGLLLGTLLDDDDTRLEEYVSLPPTLQPLHLAWFGKTGSGKSTAIINAMLENQTATEGADILLDSKGDGMPVDYLQAHYAKHGDLDDVYYFDCTEVLPALSFFDLREQLDAGIGRTTAVEDVTDHYIEMLIGVMGRDRFETAVRSPDIIRYLVKAMFDPVHGNDAYSHRELQDAATRMHETRDAPPVVDPELQAMLGGVAANSKRSFDELMQGVANRIEKIPIDDRLGLLFNHVPEDDDPYFDIREVIDEDAVVLIDTGGLRPETQRVISLVVLSQLWSALKHRTQQSDRDDLPLVNLYLEEAASVASSGLVSDLLAQSRSFGLSMTLAMQFPAQLRQTNSEAYAEVLNNVSTIITGNVGVDDDLSKRLATADMAPGDVANRLRALRRGEWLASLPSTFGTAEPRPFLLESAALPSGHPEGDEPLTGATRTAFEDAFDAVRERCREEYGLDIETASQQAMMQRHGHTSDSDDAETQSESNASPPVGAVDSDARTDSALPYTKRLPEGVSYDPTAHSLECLCGSRYAPTSDGMRHAITCCGGREFIDRDDVPICELNITMSVDERRQSPYSDAQLRFLHAVYAAHQRRFDPHLEYDILIDSMTRLQEYVGIETAAVQELLNAGLLSKDCTYPHTLYTVTPEGRAGAKIEHREGVAHGDGKGDLSESSFHVAMVHLAAMYIEAEFVDDPDSAVVEVVLYHEVDGGRLDAAGLDEDSNVVVTVEAERSNNDTLRAVPDDYDKMAAQDPKAAIWVVENRDGAHDVLEALNDPPEGDPRVEKEYSRSSPPQQFRIDEPGLTDVYTFTYLRDSILEYR